MYTNKYLIGLFNNKKKLHTKAIGINNRIKHLRTETERLDTKLDLAHNITEIYKGIPLTVYIEPTIYGKSADLYHGNPLCKRSARIWTNAHTSVNGKAKHFRISIFKCSDGPHGTRVGGDFISFKKCLEIAKEWVATGRRPKDPPK